MSEEEALARELDWILVPEGPSRIPTNRLLDLAAHVLKREREARAVAFDEGFEQGLHLGRYATIITGKVNPYRDRPS